MLHPKKNIDPAKQDHSGSLKKSIPAPKPAQKIQTAEGDKREKLRAKQAQKKEE